MQTFLSEPTLLGSVRVLDSVRLRKQFLEGWQILDAIAKTPEGGRQRVDGKYVFAANHPATNMWRNHEGALSGYLWLAKYELDKRGENTLKVTAKLEQTLVESDWDLGPGCGLPAWYKDSESRARVLITHRYNLYRKDPVHYAQYENEGTLLDTYLLTLVCCPDKVRKGKQAPYFYPPHE